MVAKIYYDDMDNNNYCGEGLYVLVVNETTVINSHFCSARYWADQDLVTTGPSRKILKQYNISKVYSNDNLIWSKNKKRNKYEHTSKL